MFKGRDDWFEVWFDDKKFMLDMMVRILQADLAAGYDYFGQSITSQREEIERYKNQFDREIDTFAEYDEAQVNRWCYYDMVKRGVIEP